MLIDSYSMGDVEDEEGKENVADVVESDARAMAESILKGRSEDVQKELLRLLMDGKACDKSGNVGVIGYEGKSDDAMFESLREVSTYKLVEVVIKRRANLGGDSLAKQVWNGYRGTSSSESSSSETSGSVRVADDDSMTKVIERFDTKPKSCYKLTIVDDDEVKNFCAAVAKERYDALLNDPSSRYLEEQSNLMDDIRCDEPKYPFLDENETDGDRKTRLMVDHLRKIFQEGEESEYPLKFYSDAILLEDYLADMIVNNNGLTSEQYAKVVDELLVVYREQEVKYPGSFTLGIVPSKGLFDVEKP